MSNMTDETLKHFLKNERKEKLYEPVRTMFSVINMIYFQAPQGEEKNKLLLLRLHEAKAEVLSLDPSWSMNRLIDLLITQMFDRIDNIDITQDWDSEFNLEQFKKLQERMTFFKHLHPNWRLGPREVAEYSNCTCELCYQVRHPIKKDDLEEIKSLTIS
jgi:hypothetical protein